MIIVLDWREWLEDVHIRRFGEITPLARIRDWVERLPVNRTAFIFDTSHPLQQEIESTWIIRGWTTRAKLVEIYNALSSTNDRVSEFSDGDTAFRRIAARLIQRAEQQREMIINQPPPRSSTMSDAMYGDTMEVGDTGATIKITKAAVKAAGVAERAAAKAAKAAAKAAEPVVPKVPGVISTLVDVLKSGGGTVEELYQHLAATFPDKTTDEGSKGGMGTTIRVQLVRLAKTGKLNIHKEKIEGRGLVYTGSAVEPDELATE